MSVRKLVFDQDLPDQTQEVTLDNQTYLLRFWWNQRVRRWMVDCRDLQENAIFLGESLNPGAVVGAGCLDFPHTVLVYAPEVQRMSDLWEGNIMVVYIPE